MYKKDGDGNNAEKVYYLNKILNCLDIFYAVELPSVWGIEHPVGSVMGRAKYQDRFFFYQGCTIGGNGINYPELGYNIVMYSNSKVLGRSHIGNNVLLSANTYVIDCDIPDNSIVFPSLSGDGRHPRIVQKSKDEMIERISHFFHNPE